MTLTRVLSVGVVATVFACGSPLSNQRSPTQAQRFDSLGGAVGHPAGAPQPLPSDALDTTGCAFVAEQRHPQPRELVDEFVHRDAEGEFVSPRDWYFSAFICGR